MEQAPDTLVVNPLVVMQATASGGVLMDVASGDCFELNQLGTEIWSRLAQSEPLSAIVGALTESYDVSPATLERDVGALVGDLLRHGLVTRQRR
jgi:hypothetical protein